MRYGIITLVVVILVLSIILLVRKNKKEDNLKPENRGIASQSECMVPSNSMLRKIGVQIERLPAEVKIDETKLVEIKDAKLLAQIDNLLPEFAKAGNAVYNAVYNSDLAKKAGGDVLYKAILPNGAKLSNSKARKGSFRGFFHNKKGKIQHANFDEIKLNSTSMIRANAVAAVAGISSMVVGQYYMTQINNELGKLNEGIQEISDFQNKEYQSKIVSLIVQTQMLAKFETEILENDELRSEKKILLDALEKDCTVLLGQANDTLKTISGKSNLKFADYEKELQKAQKWYVYQKTLLDLLCKIADLKYTLNLGKVSREQCYGILQAYYYQSESAQGDLSKWHSEHIHRYNIDINESRRKRQGIDGAAHFLPSLLKEDWKYRGVKEETANMISVQFEGREKDFIPMTADIYERDLELISKDGKIYYLPEEN